MLLALGLAAGCGPCRQDAPEGPKVLVIGSTQEPTVLDPSFEDGRAGAREITGLLFRELVRFDADWNVVGDLATGRPQVRTEAGAPVAVWTLAPHRWSDGVPVTAADVIRGWTIDRRDDLDALNHHVAIQVESMRALSDRQVEVRWKGPTHNLAHPRVHTVLPAHAYPEPRDGEPFRGMGNRPVSNGPYRLKRWVPGVQIDLEPNPHWPGPGPYLPGITFRFFQGVEALELAVRTGEVHALGEASGVQPDRIRSLAAQVDGVKAVIRPGGLWLHLGLRMDHPVLARTEVRQAIAQAMDREALAELVYGGLATPAWGPFPPRHPGFREAPRHWVPDFEWRPGEPRELTIQYAAGLPAAEAGASAIARKLDGLGFRPELEALPLRTLFGRQKARRQGDLVLFAWRTRPDWDGRSILHGDGRQNYGGYRSAEVDRWLDEAETAEDPETWADRMQRVGERFQEEVPLIPLLFRQTASLKPVGLQGWSPTGTTTPVTWNVETWRWPRPKP